MIALLLKIVLQVARMVAKLRAGFASISTHFIFVSLQHEIHRDPAQLHAQVMDKSGGWPAHLHLFYNGHAGRHLGLDCKLLTERVSLQASHAEDSTWHATHS